MKKLILCCAICQFWACMGPKLAELYFAQALVFEPDFVNFDAALLKGQALFQGPQPSGFCGFVWSDDLQSVAAVQPGAQRITLDIAGLNDDGLFSATISNLPRKKTIYVRTFVQLLDENAGERLVYSANIASFVVGEIVVNTGVPLIINDSAVVYGQLRGIMGVGTVEQTGHVISSSNPLPVIGGADCRSSTLGPRSDDQVFGSGFNHLAFNTDYYVRAYAIAAGVTYYSERVDTLHMPGGWERIGVFPSSYGRLATTVVNGAAFTGFGCRSPGGCFNGDIERNIWQFNPIGGNSWQSISSMPSQSIYVSQYNNACFTLNDKACFIFGGFNNGNSITTQSQLYIFDPVNQSWDNRVFINPQIQSRTGAIAFSLNGKAYFGSGDINGLGEDELNDFWEYDPTTEQWRAVAPLPLQLNESEPVGSTLGRSEAGYFTIDSFGYVVGGFHKGTGLRDCWRFRPPVDSGDNGSWDKMAFLPPEAGGRGNGVAMSIEGKGYFGTGYTFATGFFNDWWQYNPPPLNTWVKKTSLPTAGRDIATGFAIDGYGYLGTGRSRIVTPNGITQPVMLADFWRYVPDK